MDATDMYTEDQPDKPDESDNDDDGDGPGGGGESRTKKRKVSGKSAGNGGGGGGGGRGGRGGAAAGRGRGRTGRGERSRGGRGKGKGPTCGKGEGSEAPEREVPIDDQAFLDGLEKSVEDRGRDDDDEAVTALLKRNVDDEVSAATEAQILKYTKTIGGGAIHVDASQLAPELNMYDREDCHADVQVLHVYDVSFVCIGATMLTTMRAHPMNNTR